MLLLTVFAFLAGVVTILSPCVLPVLPLLISTSVGGGKLRPVGIVLGLAATFTTVTLVVAATVQALAVPATGLRILAIAGLGLFGLAMLVPPIGRVFERALSPLARTVDTRGPRDGFAGGLLIGAGLGLVWAPCVGPIMASVIALTVTAGLSLPGIIITLAYALGAGVPMLLLAYGARKLVSKVRRLGPRAAGIRRAFGALALATCLALLLGLDSRLPALPPEWTNTLVSLEQQAPVQQEITDLRSAPPVQAATQPTPSPSREVVMTQPTPQSLPTPTAPSPAIATPAPGIALKDLGPAPELVGISGWVNSEPLSLAHLRGKVVIIDFWTFDCYNCRNTEPYVRALYEKYKSQGLEIIGVHTPEFAFERVPDNIRSAVKDQNVTWPVAMDPDYKTWNAYKNGYWPAFYFIDARGHIRYVHIGEGNYDYNEKVVQQLLAEATQ